MEDDPKYKVMTTTINPNDPPFDMNAYLQKKMESVSANLAALAVGMQIAQEERETWEREAFKAGFIRGLNMWGRCYANNDFLEKEANMDFEEWKNEADKVGNVASENED